MNEFWIQLFMFNVILFTFGKAWILGINKLNWSPQTWYSKRKNTESQPNFASRLDTSVSLKRTLNLSLKGKKHFYYWNLVALYQTIWLSIEDGQKTLPNYWYRFGSSKSNHLTVYWRQTNKLFPFIDIDLVVLHQTIWLLRTERQTLPNYWYDDSKFLST